MRSVTLVRRQLIIPLTIATAVAMVSGGVGAAHAAELVAEQSDGKFAVTFTAGDTEINRLAISVATDSDGSTAYQFKDTGCGTNEPGCPQGVVMVVTNQEFLGAPCRLVDTQTAWCKTEDTVGIKVLLGDEDDSLSVASPTAPAVPPLVAYGAAGVDDITGGPSDDTLSGGAGGDKIKGADGNDRIDFALEEQPAGEWGGNDELSGGPGNDRLNGGPPSSSGEADTLMGGDGFDTADYAERTAPLTIDLEDPRADGEAGESDEVQADVERIVAGSDGDRLSGSGADSVLEGRAGDDTISGRGGNDQLSGGADSGTDNVSGGQGNDTIDGGGGEDELRGGDDDDVVSGGGGGDDVNGGNGGDRLYGGPGIDTIEGEAGNDTIDGAEPGITGADGGDTLSGGAGMDALAGGRGNDTMDGGGGPDTMDGDAGQDTVTYVNRSGPVTVTLDGVANDGEEGEGDNVLRTVEEVVGGAVDDTLSGDPDQNTINGASGEDDLKGNRGRDELIGGNATDLIRARDGNRDVVVCGDDEDIAITDPEDQVRDCETEDQGGRRRLSAGRTALVTPTRGDYGLQPPEGRRWFALSETLKIPIGSTIDATDGEVRVATAGRAGRRQTIFASGGRFSLRQRRGGRSGAELRLKGPLGKCPRPAGRQQSAAIQDPPKRQLKTRIVKAKKRFKVRGRYSIGAAKGTVWWTEERCDGTLTRVESGSVQVQDLVRDRTVTVRAPGTYLAQPR